MWLNKIIMIAIATYTFTKITVAIVGMVKAKGTDSPVLKTLRNISLADACVSIYTMQRSMLVSFPGKVMAAANRIISEWIRSAVGNLSWPRPPERGRADWLLSWPR